jgi:hypothetical protein
MSKTYKNKFCVYCVDAWRRRVVTMSSRSLSALPAWLSTAQVASRTAIARSFGSHSSRAASLPRGCDQPYGLSASCGAASAGHLRPFKRSMYFRSSIF